MTKPTKEELMAIYNSDKVTNYFSGFETRCRCGCGLDIKPEMRAKANEIRSIHGYPMGVTSGARCVAYNVKIGGAKKSRHIQGRAVDFVWTQELQNFLEKNCETLEYSLEDPSKTPGWLHVDLDKRNGKFGIFKP